jgi:hypothetical protein
MQQTAKYLPDIPLRQVHEWVGIINNKRTPSAYTFYQFCADFACFGFSINKRTKGKHYEKTVVPVIGAFYCIFSCRVQSGEGNAACG